MKSAAMSVDWQAKLRTKLAHLSKIPCIFPASREFPRRDGFAADWLVSQVFCNTNRPKF
jgi:hypothetical protein